MSRSPYATSPQSLSTMPPGIPYIIGNEAAERFSFYGMRTILTVFMVKYLWLMGEKAGTPMSDAEAVARFHLFTSFVYLTPLLGAVLADGFFGKYPVIMVLSIVYCLGHAALAMMGWVGDAEVWLMVGLWLIILGSGGIKPCVSAHVGDQFGAKNAHLIPKVFNWFYWSINLGAFLSSLLTPWLLEWYGPHLAFGVPGVLMALATLVFWMGRTKFVHIPAKGARFLGEVFSREGMAALLKLSSIYVFVALFWALFDQQSSSWVLQAENMDRRWLGIEWLPSQIQVMNPILILTFIPLFSYVVYPAIDRVFPLTPLRKMSIGMFLMAAAFAVVSIAQEQIDGGATPSISWQLAGFVLMTAAEVMISIVCLEFSYTQAPRTMKSFVMAFFLVAVFAGNLFTAGVNKVIQVPDPVEATAGETITIAGIDGDAGTPDDIVATFDEDGKRTSLAFASREPLARAAEALSGAIRENGFVALDEEAGNRIVSDFEDAWGNPFRYTLVHRALCRIDGAGADGRPLTRWDEGALLTLSVPSEPHVGPFAKIAERLHPAEPWGERRKAELGIPTEAERAAAGPQISTEFYVGGRTRLEGATYFWFFTGLMGVAAFLFVVVARLYRPRDYLHEEAG